MSVKYLTDTDGTSNKQAPQNSVKKSTLFETTFDYKHELKFFRACSQDLEITLLNLIEERNIGMTYIR